jgi:6-phosphogluconolactonase
MRHEGYIALNGEKAGIWLFAFDPTTGEVELSRKVLHRSPAAFMAVHPMNRALYIAAMDPNFDPESEALSGRVLACRIDPKTKNIERIDEKPTFGSTSCHVGTEPTGRVVMVVNFRRFGRFGGPGGSSRGSVCVYPLDAEGGLLEPGQAIEREGSSVHPVRQTNSHPHAVVAHPGGRWIFIPDLGTDELMIHQLDVETGRLVPGPQASVSFPRPTGPRHLAIHPNGRTLYVVSECVSVTTVLDFDPATGRAEIVQSVSTLPAECIQGNSCADVQITPDGRWLYASNRGQDSLAIYAVDGDGSIEARDWFTAPGFKPGEFVLSPNGGHLLTSTGNGLFVLGIGGDGRLTEMRREPSLVGSGALAFLNV